jgi:anti-sigma factor RsiW
MIETALALCKGPECKNLRAHLSDLLDGQLSPAQSAKAKAHLKACPSCAKEYAQFKAMVKACQELPGPVLSASCREKLQRLYKRWAKQPLKPKASKQRKVKP